jgi:hypothetical protein
MATIKVDEQNIPIHIDTHGNLYFEIKNTDIITTDGVSPVYQLNVDQNNEPYLDIGDYHIVDMSDKKNVYEHSKLNTGKIVKSEIFINDKYFPEDNGHALIYQNSSMYPDEDLDDDAYFIFYQTDNKIQVDDRNFGDINALYDVFIYDDSDKDAQPQLIFQSKLQNEISIYRAILYTSGKFFFRAIGCFIEKSYKLVIKNNTIECISS